MHNFAQYRIAQYPWIYPLSNHLQFSSTVWCLTKKKKKHWADTTTGAGCGKSQSAGLVISELSLGDVSMSIHNDGPWTGSKGPTTY